MVVRFYRRIFPDLPEPDFAEIRKAMESRAEGTPLRGVPKVNTILKGPINQLEFDFIDLAKYPDIRRELDLGQPVIAWMKPERGAPISHSVVIKGTSRDDLMIQVEDPDPDHPEREWPTSEFMNYWNNSDRTLIRARVTQRGQQSALSEFN